MYKGRKTNKFVFLFIFNSSSDVVLLELKFPSAPFKKTTRELQLSTAWENKFFFFFSRFPKQVTSMVTIYYSSAHPSKPPINRKSKDRHPHGFKH